MNELALFAGAGGGLLGSKLLGWNPICGVEKDPHCIGVLLQRQNDGQLPPFPIWDEVETFDGRPWKGIADVVSGGFPCQDISRAGTGKGIDGERSGLWFHMARIISEVLPRFVFVENSSTLTSRGLHRVCADLSRMGYDSAWGTFEADHYGFPQKRKRLYLVAHSMCRNSQMGGHISGSGWKPEQIQEHLARTAKSEPPMVGMVDGMANRMGRLKAIGNGQVPAVAAHAFLILSNRIIQKQKIRKS